MSVAIAAALAACGQQRDARSDNRPPERAASAHTGSLRGSSLPEPLSKPAFVFDRVDGTPYDFVRETNGKVALLFFGYTHCPDVCPLHMANIAAVMKQMSFEERDAIRVVFVTTDPARDTPARLHEWLGSFDPAFVGLRAPEDAVQGVQRSLGLAPSARGRDSAGSYLVGHAAQVIAFGPDNLARVVYPFGTRQEDWAHDLPLLVRRTTATAAASMPSTRQPDTSLPDFAIAPAVAAAGTDGSSAVMYFSLLNNTDQPDTLRAVTVIGAGPATLHVTTNEGGIATMRGVQSLVIRPHERLEMRPGGAHVMLEAATVPAAAGRALAVELHFARRGRVTLPVTVVSYAQLDSVLALARSALPR